MRKFLTRSLLLAALAATPAFAEPSIQARWADDQLLVTLQGTYGGSWYQVWRAGGAAGPFGALQSDFTLCTGDCFVADAQAVPGATYWYRFDVQAPGGALVSYGPFPVTVPDTPLGARVWPNPSRAAVRIELSLPGSARQDAPLAADARVLDLQGRTVRVLHTGLLARGRTSIALDGRSDAGQALRAGVYFVRFATPLGTTTRRLVRIE